MLNDRHRRSRRRCRRPRHCFLISMKWTCVRDDVSMPMTNCSRKVEFPKYVREFGSLLWWNSGLFVRFCRCICYFRRLLAIPSFYFGGCDLFHIHLWRVVVVVGIFQILFGRIRWRKAFATSAVFQQVGRNKTIWEKTERERKRGIDFMCGRAFYARKTCTMREKNSQMSMSATALPPLLPSPSTMSCKRNVPANN